MQGLDGKGEGRNLANGREGKWLLKSQLELAMVLCGPISDVVLHPERRLMTNLQVSP